MMMTVMNLELDTVCDLMVDLVCVLSMSISLLNINNS